MKNLGRRKAVSNEEKGNWAYVYNRRDSCCQLRERASSQPEKLVDVTDDVKN